MKGVLHYPLYYEQAQQLFTLHSIYIFRHDYQIVIVYDQQCLTSLVSSDWFLLCCQKKLVNFSSHCIIIELSDISSVGRKFLEIIRGKILKFKKFAFR